MLLSRKEELADNEEVLLRQYTHWWIFVVPCLLLFLGIYLWLKALSKGSFSLYSLLIFDEPREITGSMSAYVNSYLYQGSQLLQENIPESIYRILSGIHLHPRKWLSQIVLLYAFYRLIRATLTFISTRILVTNQRVLINTGVFRPQTVTFPKMHIDAFHVKKGLLSRFVNVGTLIIQASGGLTARLPAIQTPEILTTIVIEGDQ